MAGKPVHVELPAQDSAKAKEFYSSLFGWQLQSYGDQDYHMVQIDESSGAAISGGDTSHNPVIYFDTDDIDESISKVKALGGSVEEKQPVPGMGWFVACKDNQGTAFSLWQSDESAPTPGS
jgi:predicted enzyme related to lactoylglutathione lyase